MTFGLILGSLLAGVLSPDSPAHLKFLVYSADGMVGPAPIERIAEDWSTRLSADRSVEVAGKDLLGIRRAGQILPSWPVDSHLIFVNGDRVSGSPVELRSERLRFQPATGKTELIVPLSALSVIWFAFPDGLTDREAVLRPWQTGRRTRDIVLLRNRDQMEGTLSDLDAQTVRLRGKDRKEIRLERDKVAAVILSNDLSRSLRPRGPYARVVLGNGSRISLASGKSEGALLVGKTLFGGRVELPLDQVIALDIYQGRAVYLSDLKPVKYEFTPYLDITWPYQQDRSVAGNPLKLVTGVFDKGLGMHSESRITYRLGGEYQWFEATVGLDEATGRLGSAGIGVLVDGKPQNLGSEEDLTFLSPLRYLRLKVAGARELTLLVHFGRQGDVQDHVDWADARLIK
jgi:hypothetical protein